MLIRHSAFAIFNLYFQMNQNENYLSLGFHTQEYCIAHFVSVR